MTTEQKKRLIEYFNEQRKLRDQAGEQADLYEQMTTEARKKGDNQTAEQVLKIFKAYESEWDKYHQAMEAIEYVSEYVFNARICKDNCEEAYDIEEAKGREQE